jgi:hypothetical protein
MQNLYTHDSNSNALLAMGYIYDDKFKLPLTYRRLYVSSANTLLDGEQLIYGLIKV